MVRLHVKKGDESQFLFETTVDMDTSELIKILLRMYHTRLKIYRICEEIENLTKHGTHLPPNMIGLTDEQIKELKLSDDWGEQCLPSGGHTFDKDPMGKRNGKKPSEKMQMLLTRTIGEVKSIICKKQIEFNICLTEEILAEQLRILKGVCMIVYPMNLPPQDPIRMEFEDKEELVGQDSLMIIPDKLVELWFCGKQIFPDKKLKNFIGSNEKSKVIVKIQKKGQGPPGREPVITEEQRKQLMLEAHRKNEIYKKLEADDDDSYLNSQWADGQSLKRSFQGLKDIKWKPL